MAGGLKRPLYRNEDLSSDLQKWGFPELLSPPLPLLCILGPYPLSAHLAAFTAHEKGMGSK